MKFTRIAWTDDAERCLQRVLPIDADMDFVRREVQTGVSRLFKVDECGSYLITRVEGKELVGVAYVGSDYRGMALCVYERAILEGFHSVRVHVTQPGIARMLRDYFPEPVEQVLRVYLDGRQKQSIHC